MFSMSSIVANHPKLNDFQREWIEKQKTRTPVKKKPWWHWPVLCTQQVLFALSIFWLYASVFNIFSPPQIVINILNFTIYAEALLLILATLFLCLFLGLALFVLDGVEEVNLELLRKETRDDLYNNILDQLVDFADGIAKDSWISSRIWAKYNQILFIVFMFGMIGYGMIVYPIILALLTGIFLIIAYLFYKRFSEFFVNLMTPELDVKFEEYRNELIIKAANE